MNRRHDLNTICVLLICFYICNLPNMQILPAGEFFISEGVFVPPRCCPALFASVASQPQACGSRGKKIESGTPKRTEPALSHGFRATRSQQEGDGIHRTHPVLGMSSAWWWHKKKDGVSSNLSNVNRFKVQSDAILPCFIVKQCCQRILCRP